MYKKMSTEALWEALATAWLEGKARTRARIKRELQRRGELRERVPQLPPDTDIQARHAIGCVP